MSPLYESTAINYQTTNVICVTSREVITVFYLLNRFSEVLGEEIKKLKPFFKLSSFLLFKKKMYPDHFYYLWSVQECHTHFNVVDSVSVKLFALNCSP